MAKELTKQPLRKAMNVYQLVLVAVGSIIGAGFFLGSGIPLAHTGRSAILAYLMGGIFMYLIISILAEMTATEPVEGGFSTFAENYFGPWIGFVSGWMYWTSGVLTMASEVVAAAIFSTWWFPHLPLWVFAVIYSLIMVLANTRDTTGFARLEGLLSIMKLVALFSFIMIVGFNFFKTMPWPGSIPGPIQPQVPLFSHGWRGFLSSMPFVMFSYTGISVVAMAAAETRHPERTIPRAIGIIVLIVLSLYLSSIFLVDSLLLGKVAGTNISPFILVLNHLRLSLLASIMNIVILIAALSSMNTALYGVARMLRSLSERGDAPHEFAQLNPDGVPTTALWVSSVALGLTITLSYFLPKTAFATLVGGTSLISMFNWGLISLIHIRFRKTNTAPKPFQTRGFPWTSYLAFAIAVIVALSAWLNPDQRVGFIGFLIIFALYSIVYYFKMMRYTL